MVTAVSGGEVIRGRSVTRHDCGGKSAMTIAQTRVYTLPYLQVLVGGMLTMVGVSMAYHFGEYVAYRGYSKADLGWIMAIGSCGSLILRPFAGGWIDRVGCRFAFLGSALPAATASLLLPLASSFVVIGVLRVLITAANATYLATVAVYASQAAPAERRAESLGTVGIGGFAGMLIGPALGDAIFHEGPTTQAMRTFFVVIAVVTALAGLAVVNLNSPRRPGRVPVLAFFQLARRHWPGTIVLVSIVFTAILTIHITFLERLAHDRGFDDIRYFFYAYAPTAIGIRIVFRRAPQVIGRRRICVVGLVVLGLGTLLLIPVGAEWHLVFPALLTAVGHALVFPSMVDLTAQSFPPERRGVGTSVALGAGDFGFILGGVAWGQLIEARGFATVFVIGAGITWLTALLYVWRRRVELRASPDADGLSRAA